MKLHGARQKGHHRSLSSGLGLQVLAITLACSATAATNQSITLPVEPTSNICTVEATSEWRATLQELIEVQNYNSAKARETLFGFYIPEIAKLIQELPVSERQELASDILHWLDPDNFERGLELKSRSTEVLSPDEISLLISFETCWQSLLAYVLTINPEYQEVENFNIHSRPNYFNEPLSDVARVDKNKYLVFLVSGTIKLSEILRSAKVLANLAEKQGNQICAQIPSSQGYIKEAPLLGEVKSDSQGAN